jgi:hypothetical protein
VSPTGTEAIGLTLDMLSFSWKDVWKGNKVTW